MKARNRFQSQIEEYIVMYYDDADLQDIIDFTQQYVRILITTPTILFNALL